MATDGATGLADTAAQARIGTWLVEDLTANAAGELDALGSPVWTTMACWRLSKPQASMLVPIQPGVHSLRILIATSHAPCLNLQAFRREPFNVDLPKTPAG